ncbi:MAG: GPW/gp25 family protein [Cyanobacteriota bacterium]|jgi:phage baseplate assembly protein W
MSQATPAGPPASALQRAARSTDPLAELASLLGQGLAFPPRVGGDGRMQWAIGETSVTDAITIILGTNPGERIGLPRFGAGLDRFLFEGNNPGTHARIAEAIATALKAAEPRIQLESIRVEADPSSPETALATIHWRLVASGAAGRATVSVPVGRA